VRNCRGYGVAKKEKTMEGREGVKHEVMYRRQNRVVWKHEGGRREGGGREEEGGGLYELQTEI
jgi:hypothetical protein